MHWLDIPMCKRGAHEWRRDRPHGIEECVVCFRARGYDTEPLDGDPVASVMPTSVTVAPGARNLVTGPTAQLATGSRGPKHTERDRQIAIRRSRGESPSKLAAEFGVHPSRIPQIVHVMRDRFPELFPLTDD